MSEKIRKTPRRRLAYRIAEEDLVKYPLEVLNCYFVDSGMEQDAESKAYMSRIMKEWSKPEYAGDRLPESICDMGAGKIKEFKDATDAAALGPNGFRYLRDERERRMNRLQKQNSRRRRTGGRGMDSTPGSAGTGGRSASRSSSNGRRSSNRRRDRSHANSHSSTGLSPSIHPSKPQPELTSGNTNPMLNPNSSSSLPMYLMSPVPGFDSSVFNDLLGQPLFDDMNELTPDPAALLASNSELSALGLSVQSPVRTARQSSRGTGDNHQHSGDGNGGMKVISHFNGVPVMMPANFNMDQAALQHMLSSIYNAQTVNNPTSDPPVVTQASIEETAKALLKTMPEDTNRMHSQLAGLLTKVDSRSEDSPHGHEPSEADLQSVRDFFASQLDALKQHGVPVPDELGESALDVITTMAKRLQQDRMNSKRPVMESSSPRGAAKRKKAKRGERGDMPPPNKPLGIGNNGGRPPTRRQTASGPSPLVPPGASSQQVQSLQTVWENKDIISHLREPLVVTPASTSSTSSSSSSYSASSSSSMPSSSMANTSMPNPLHSPAGQMAMQLLHSTDLTNDSPSQLHKALFTTSPFKIPQSPAGKGTADGSGYEMNGIAIDQLVMFSPARATKHSRTTTSGNSLEEAPPTMPTVHETDLSNFPYPSSPVPNHDNRPILVAPSPLPHLLSNSPMHYVLSPMPGSGFNLFSNVFSPATANKAAEVFDDLAHDDSHQSHMSDDNIHHDRSAHNGGLAQHSAMNNENQSMSNHTTHNNGHRSRSSRTEPAMVAMSQSNSRLHNRRFSSGQPQASPKNLSPGESRRDWHVMQRSPLALPSNTVPNKSSSSSSSQPSLQRRPSFDKRIDMAVKTSTTLTPSRLRDQSMPTSSSSSSLPGEGRRAGDPALMVTEEEQRSPTSAELAASEVGVLPLNPTVSDLLRA